MVPLAATVVVVTGFTVVVAPAGTVVVVTDAPVPTVVTNGVVTATLQLNATFNGPIATLNVAPENRNPIGPLNADHVRSFGANGTVASTAFPAPSTATVTEIGIPVTDCVGSTVPEPATATSTVPVTV